MNSNSNFMNKWVDVSNNEVSRTYHYPDGSSFKVVGTTAFHAKVSYGMKGVAHRLKTQGDKIFYIAPGWNAIEIVGSFIGEEDEAVN